MTDWSWYGEALFWLGLIGAGAAYLFRSPLWTGAGIIILIIGGAIALMFD